MGALRKYKLPRFVYVTNMDVDNASYRQIVEDLKEKYGKKIAPFNLPIRENEHFVRLCQRRIRNR